jgi:hypothetical protein
MMLDMNQLAADEEDEDYNVKFGGSESKDIQRMSDTNNEGEEGDSKLIDYDQEEGEDLFEEDSASNEYKHAKERSSLKIIDQAHSSKMEGKHTLLTLFRFEKD